VGITTGPTTTQHQANGGPVGYGLPVTLPGLGFQRGDGVQECNQHQDQAVNSAMVGSQHLGLLLELCLVNPVNSILNILYTACNLF